MFRMMLDDKYAAMPWEEIDAVVFDVGRVLLDFQHRELLERILPGREEIYDELIVRVFLSPYWVMRDHGTCTLEEAIAGMSAGTPHLEEPIREMMTKWIDLIPMEEGIAVMKKCREMGKRVFILSNYADEPFAYAERKYDFMNLAERRFVSSRIGYIKPDPRIYQHVVDETGIAPHRLLFIDDAPANIEAALMAGWQGVCYRYKGQLKAFFGA